ncbi:MAG: CHAP domain-containing protein [Butyricicoccus sp.]|nr:CHAP domain-containing protein [Butyricicoccus sp.]
MLGNQAILSVAAGEIGCRESADGYTKYGAWYGLPNDPWCAMFVSWCAEQCGYIRAGICPKLAYTPDIVHWFQSRGQWYSRTITPPAGAYILFDWDGDGGADHVGLVEYVEAGQVHTIEGNSSNMVHRNSYPAGSTQILGYGVPHYP